jgi:CheY-like chemotaxis protein
VIPNSAYAPRPGSRILVVDDSEDTVESLALFLGDSGFEVQTAHCGSEAIRDALAQRPDSVLLDVGLPRMDGWQVARRLRQEITAPLVILALTGFGRPKDSQRSHEAGIDLHLLKPVDPDRLLALLSRTEPAGSWEGRPPEEERRSPVGIVSTTPACRTPGIPRNAVVHPLERTPASPGSDGGSGRPAHDQGGREGRVLAPDLAGVGPPSINC